MNKVLHSVHLTLLNIALAQSAFASSYKVVCYYQDVDPSSKNTNGALMLPSKVYGFARSNYDWALNEASQQINLNGSIVDGFFNETNLTYAQVLAGCDRAIQKGTRFYPAKLTYRLYDFKASESNFSSSEYPIAFASSPTQPNPQIDRIVAFGDSLSDSGNLKRWLKVMPFFPYWFGRFSNGPVWNEYVSYHTQMPVLNFAYGGAKTEGTNDEFLDLVPQNILDYLKTDATNHVTGNSRDTILRYLTTYLTDDSYQTQKSYLSHPEKTLYTMWVGANDFDEKLRDTELLKNLFEHPYSLGGGMFVAERAAENIFEQGYMLTSAGAQNMVFIGLPDMGKAPLVFDLDYSFSSDTTQNHITMSQKLSEITRYFNAHLAQKVAQLKAQFPRAHIEFLDINEVMSPLLSESGMAEYQFDAQNSGLVVTDQNTSFSLQKRCNLSGYLGGYFEKDDAARNQYMQNNHCLNSAGELAQRPMFWDSVHPSSYSHCLMSYSILKHFNATGFMSTPLPKLADYQKLCQDFGESQYAHFERFSKSD